MRLCVCVCVCIGVSAIVYGFVCNKFDGKGMLPSRLSVCGYAAYVN